MLSVGLGAAAAEAENQAQALAERRQQMIEACVRNRGTQEDCERQVDTELAAEGLERQQSQGDEGRRRRR